MRLEERVEGRDYGRTLVEKLKDGTFPKNNLPNHSVNFTGGPEQLAREAFDTYIGSCGYLLMQLRLKKEDEVYHG